MGYFPCPLPGAGRRISHIYVAHALRTPPETALFEMAYNTVLGSIRIHSPRDVGRKRFPSEPFLSDADYTFDCSRKKEIFALMDVTKIISELRKELDRIDKAVLALDSIGAGKRRGRPPKLLQELRAEAEAQKRKPAAKKKARRASKQVS